MNNSKEKLEREAIEKLSLFMGDLNKSFLSQLRYDIETNLPAGIIKSSEVVDHSITQAIVSAIGALVKWDVAASIEIAADIAENVNAHPEAVKIRKMAYTETEGKQ